MLGIIFMEASVTRRNKSVVIGTSVCLLLLWKEKDANVASHQFWKMWQCKVALIWKSLQSFTFETVVRWNRNWIEAPALISSSWHEQKLSTLSSPSYKNPKINLEKMKKNQGKKCFLLKTKLFALTHHSFANSKLQRSSNFLYQAQAGKSLLKVMLYNILLSVLQQCFWLKCFKCFFIL